MQLDLSTLIVHDYDDAIRFFVDVLGFELTEDGTAWSRLSAAPPTSVQHLPE